jgi:serine/threonine protein kinase
MALMEKSLLLEASQLKTIRQQFTSTINNGAENLAQTLVKNSFITPYQGRQLLTGKYRGFYLAGKYKLLEMLGSGGMGKVFLAEQITMHRLVAIKIVKRVFKTAEQQKEVLARFSREARAVAALSHPNIIHAYDFDQENGVPYIVMEYVEGIDAAQQVIKFGPLNPGQTCDFGVQSARALSQAHRAGMVHRDVKPQNLLISTSGEVKLLDLGLCTVFDGTQDDSLTVTENQLGTVDYIAPEQALDSHNVDQRADIYSLGATLYTLITGRVLFSGKTTPQKLILCQTTEPTPLLVHAPNTPPELAQIIHKMLSKKPEDRQTTMAEVEAQLAPFVQRISPPYDISAVKYTFKALNGFLGRSPDSESLSGVGLLGSPEDNIKSDSDRGPGNKNTTSRAGGSSMISVNETQPVDDDDFLNQLAKLDKQVDDDDEPPLIGKSSSSKKRGGKRNAKNQGNDNNVVTVIFAGLALVVAVIAILINIYLSAPAKKQYAPPPNTSNNAANQKTTTPPKTTNTNDKKPATNSTPPKTEIAKANTSPAKAPASNSTVKPNPTPTPTKSEPKPETKPVPKPEPKPEPKPPVATKEPELTGFKRWDKAIDKTLGDESIRWGLTFKNKNAPSGKLPYQTNNDVKGSDAAQKALVIGKWTAGRWPEKGGVELRGGKFIEKSGGNDGIAILQTDLGEIYDYDRGFSMVLWVKISGDAAVEQCIISRANNHFRLNMQAKSGTLKWSMNRSGSSRYSDLKGNRKLDDGNWHQVVVTYTNSDATNAEVRLYVDGTLDAVGTGQRIKTDQVSVLLVGSPHPDQDASHSLKANVDEFLVLARALPLEEIQQMYNDGKP